VPVCAWVCAAFLPTACGPQPHDKGGEVLNSLHAIENPAEMLPSVEAALQANPRDCSLVEARAALLILADSSELQLEVERAVRLSLDQCGRIGFLVDLMKSRKAGVRQTAATMAATFRQSHLAPEIRKLTEDRDPNVRAAAIRALVRLEDKESRVAVFFALKDGNWKVRSEAAAAAPVLCEPGDVVRLFPLLEDSDEYVRYQAQSALPLFCTVANQKIFREAAAGRHGSAAVVPAALGLSRIGDVEAWDVLADTVKSPTGLFRTEAIGAMAHLDPRRASVFFSERLRRETDPKMVAALQKYMTTGTQADPTP
jgi:hypothetical protein